jgi:hypothetical protein
MLILVQEILKIQAILLDNISGNPENRKCNENKRPTAPSRQTGTVGLFAVTAMVAHRQSGGFVNPA